MKIVTDYNSYIFAELFYFHSKIMRAFRIDENLPLENRLRLRASAMAVDEPTQVILTAEQYRLGAQK